MPTTRSGRFYNNGHGGNHEISRPSGGRQRLDRRATSSFAAAAADPKEEKRAHTLKRTADSNHGYSNSTLDCDDTEIHNRSSHTTAPSNQRKNSPRKKARVATTGSALRLPLNSEQVTTAGTIPILSTGPTNQADDDAPTKTAVASNVRAPPLAPSVNVATVTPGILPAAAFYSTPAAALPLQASSALSTEESNPRQRTKVLPDGVVPIFQLDEYSSSNNAAMSRLLLSAEPSDSHSTTTALGFATPTTTTPAIATSSRQPPAPHMARSTVTTNNAAPAQQVWSVWCSLVHMHVTVYGADYWRALVSRERLEAAATANWSNHDASSSSTNSEALTAPTWDEPPSDKEDDATSNPDTNLPSTQDSNNTTATFASPRRQHPSRTAAASAAAAGDDSLASSTTSIDSPSSSSDSGYDLPVVDDSQSSARLPHQPLLTVKMRRVLVLWLSEVVQEYKLSEAAYHLSVTLLDSVLARGPSDYRSEQHGILEAALAPESEQGNEWLVRPRDFQALGCACLWIASKLEDTTPPMAENLVYISNYCFTTDKLCELETRICRALQFRLHRITPYHFVVLYLRASRACPVAMTTLQPHQRSSFDDENDDGNPNMMLSMTLYLIELCRSSHAMSEKPPSLLAAAAVYLARATLGVRNVEANNATIVDSSSLGKSYWTRTLAYYTGYNLDEMVETIGQLHRLHRAAERAPATGSPVPAFTKYQAAAHHRVSLKTVRLAEDLGIF